MHAILNRIFLRKLGISRFFLSGFAFLTGFTLVLLALQGYIRIRDYITPQKNTSSYIIINKEVAFAHTLLGGRAQFTKEEIDDLRQQPFVADLGVFKSNKFEARVHLGGALGFYSEMFFESVPTRFIDNKPARFTWHEGDDFVPLIISQDFLNLYNFGYAMGKGTPQLSKSTIELVPLKVDISGVLGRKVFNAKVVGFSERITSILVPEDFLSWANTAIGNSTDQAAARIIIKTKNEKADALEGYLKKKNLTISDEKLKLGKLLTAINIVMSALVLIGTAFILFSLVIVMLNFSLMVAHAKEEVSLLLQLGYKTRHLVRHLSVYLLVFLGSVSMVSAIVFAAANNLFINFLVSNGVEVTKNISPEVIFSGAGFVLISALVSYYSIRRLIRKQVLS
jgi:hypothetical protein